MGVVIAISGAPGSGKSTVSRALARALGDAAVVPMDDYEHMTRQSMEALADWAARGADVNELPVPLLDEHLGALKAGRPVTHPTTGEPVRPARYLVFETQFGRDHRATGRHIDLLVWLDTPREVALARTLRQLVAGALAAPAGEQGARLQWLGGYLDNYLALVRQLLVRQHERVRPGAELVVDGMGDPREIAAALRAEVVRRFGAPA